MGVPVFNGIGSAIGTTLSTFTVAAPVDQTNLDINIIAIACKPWDLDFILPTGWEKVASYYSGEYPPFEDVGSVRITLLRGFGKTGDVTLSANQPVSSLVARMMSWTRDDGDGWLIDFAYGADTNWFADYNVAGGTNFHAEAEDVVMAISALANDAADVSAPSQFYPGLTLEVATNLANNPVSVGTNCLLRIDQCNVVSGTQTGNPLYSFTSAEHNWGATIFMRMHSSPAELTVEPIGPMSHTAGYKGFANNIDEYDFYFIQRVEVSGRYAPELIRGGGWVSVGGRSSIPYTDYEFHFTDKNGQPCVYRNELYLYKSGVLQDVLYTPEYTPEFDRQDTSSFDYQRAPMAFLKDVTTPSLNIPVTIKDIRGFSRRGRVLGRYDVIGKKNPVVITDVTSGMTGEMEILVHLSPNWTHGFGTANRDFKVEELIDQGDVYYYQNVLPMFSGIKDFYFTIDDVTFRRENASISPFNGLPITVWTIKFTEVDRPGGLDISVGGGIWETVDSSYLTWTDVDSLNTTFLELYQRLDVGGLSVPSV